MSVHAFRRHFMSHYLTDVTESDTVVQTWRHLSALTHRIYKSAVSSLTPPSVSLPHSLHTTEGQTTPEVMSDEVSSADLITRCSEERGGELPSGLDLPRNRGLHVLANTSTSLRGRIRRRFESRAEMDKKKCDFFFLTLYTNQID